MIQQTDVQLLYENAATPASKRIANAIAKRHQLKTYASVKRATSQAVRDAQNGDQDAIEWLDVVVPDWQEDMCVYETHDLIAMHAAGIEF